MQQELQYPEPGDPEISIKRKLTKMPNKFQCSINWQHTAQIPSIRPLIIGAYVVLR